jgi:hypothetical protein
MKSSTFVYIEPRTYRFRAETKADARRFLAHIPDRKIIHATIAIHSPFPDALCEVRVQGFHLDHLRDICRRIADGHVMLQTIQPAAAYTGERNYDLR